MAQPLLDINRRLHKAHRNTADGYEAGVMYALLSFDLNGEDRADLQQYVIQVQEPGQTTWADVRKVEAPTNPNDALTVTKANLAGHYLRTERTQHPENTYRLVTRYFALLVEDVEEGV